MGTDNGAGSGVQEVVCGSADVPMQVNHRKRAQSHKKRYGAFLHTVPLLYCSSVARVSVARVSVLVC